jgi:hypothetical protein
MSDVNQEEARSEVEEREPHADEMKLARNRMGALRRAKTATRASRRAISERVLMLDLDGRKNEGSMKR